MELWPGLRGGGDDVRDGRPLPGGGQDHGQEGAGQGSAGEGALPYGEDCIVLRHLPQMEGEEEEH